MMLSDSSFSLTPSLEGSLTPSWPSLDMSSSDSLDDSTATFIDPEQLEPRIRAHRTLAPNLTRRSHKKSRAGCFSCKTRKIKCQETKPACENCILKDLTCQYPTQGKTSSSRNNAVAISRRPPSLLPISMTSDTFTLTDMRLFHHFLTMAYPHLPLGNEKAWVNEIPKFANQHEYLMHAMLALAASHLDRISPVAEYTTKALVHRGKAMAGLSQALARNSIEYGEGDAMVATSYALSFQSTYMGDGLFDFITMVRGCALITGRVIGAQVPTAFNLQPEWHIRLMEPRMKNLPEVHEPLLNNGLVALEKVRLILVSAPEFQFYESLIRVLRGLKRSSTHGYKSFIQVYAIWYTLCNEDFKEFMDPNNMVAQILLAYFIAIQFIMVPISQHEWPRRFDGRRTEVLGGVIEQAQRIFDAVPRSMHDYLVWPLEISAIAKAEMGGLYPEGRVLRLQDFVIA